MIVPKRDNHGRPFSGCSRSRCESFLVEQGLVSEQTARYFVRWVEQFLETAKVEAARLPLQRVSAFLDQLGRQGEPWKVGEAGEAIRLDRYFERTCKGRQAQVGAKSATGHTADPQRRALAAEMPRVLRLQHRKWGCRGLPEPMRRDRLALTSGSEHVEDAIDHLPHRNRGRPA